MQLDVPQEQQSLQVDQSGKACEVDLGPPPPPGADPWVRLGARLIDVVPRRLPFS